MAAAVVSCRPNAWTVRIESRASKAISFASDRGSSFALSVPAQHPHRGYNGSVKTAAVFDGPLEDGGVAT